MSTCAIRQCSLALFGSRLSAMRIAIRLLILSALLALSACRLPPPAAIVDFPDDPRVLHGNWELTVRGRAEGIDTFHLSQDAANLVIYPGAGSVRAYRADDQGGYSLTDASAFEGLTYHRRYDPALDAVVALYYSGSTIRVNVVPMDGSPSSRRVFAPPSGFAVERYFAGSGRVFAVLRSRTSGETELRWWDSLTGVHEGTVQGSWNVDGLRVSSNGRLVVFWNLAPQVSSVQVFDTALPGEFKSVELSSCRSSDVSEVSPDGRWFVFEDCLSNLLLVDLTDLAAGASPLRVKRGAIAMFALDSPEIVRIDREGVVHALDVETGAARILTRLTATEAGRHILEGGAWHEPRPVFVSSAAVLAVPTGGGHVTLVDTDDETRIAALPQLELERAELQLEATLDSPLREHRYSFAGTLHLDGVQYRIEGIVDAYGFHKYVPTDESVTPQFSGAPYFRADAEAWAPGAADPSYSLRLMGFDRYATVYYGGLLRRDGQGADHNFSVEIQRSTAD